MSDYLLDLSRNPLTKRLVRQLRLPIPLPEPLRRGGGPWVAAELAGLTVAVGGARGAPLTEILERLVTAEGGHLASDPQADALHGLVFDGTGLVNAGGLGALYDFVKPRLRALAPCSRVLLLGSEPAEARTAEAAAAAEALIGFGKSLAKELGRRGGTCQVLLVAAGAADERYLAGPLRFFLAPRSAFISGQVVRLSNAAPAPDPAATGATQPFAGKVALVTGAAQGIGNAIARRLAAEGARVFVLDRPQERTAVEALAQELRGVSVLVDLLDPNASRDIAKRVEADAGQLDLLVSNAGITRDKTLARMPRDWWDDTLHVNLTAPIQLAEAFVSGDGSELIKLLNPGGRLVFLSSVSGIAGNFGQTNYAAAKAGIAGYVRALAPRVAARGITVNALAPGFIETRMTQSMPMAVREVARRFNALSQGGQPEDVAEAAVFLASPGSAGVTGEVLRVCGLNLVGA